MVEAHNANKTDKTIYTKFGLKKQKERGHFRDLGPHKKLKHILKENDKRVCTRFIWLKIRASDRLIRPQ